MKGFVTTSKGFKVIPVNLVEIQKFGAVAPVCDSCGVALLFGGTFIPVLANRTYCDNCYKEWHETAVNYPEDRNYETLALDRALRVLNR